MHPDQLGNFPTQFHGEPTPGNSSAYVASTTSMNNHLQHESYLLPHRRTAINILLDHDLELPPSDSLSLIVESAVAACELFFAAAIHHPSSVQLNQVFERFVLRCVSVSADEVLQ